MGKKQDNGFLRSLSVPVLFVDPRGQCSANRAAQNRFHLSVSPFALSDLFPELRLPFLTDLAAEGEGLSAGRCAIPAYAPGIKPDYKELSTVSSSSQNSFEALNGFGSLEIEAELPTLIFHGLTYRLLTLPTPGGHYLVFLEDSHENERALLSFMPSYGSDLRRPLTTILSSISLFSGQIEENPKMRHYLEMVMQGCFQLLRLSNNMMELPGYLLGEAELTLGRYDLVQFAHEVLHSVAPFAASKDIGLKLSAPSSPLFFSFDSQKLERALLNLLSNAVKFTKHGGEVTLSVSGSGDLARVSVTDNGAGMTKKKVAQITNHFIGRSGHESAHKMGLAIVRAIAELHGGQMEIVSRLGEGTTVTLNLPHSSDAPTVLKTRTMGYDYTGEFSHALVEMSDAVHGFSAFFQPVSFYKKP